MLANGADRMDRAPLQRRACSLGSDSGRRKNPRSGWRGRVRRRSRTASGSTSPAKPPIRKPAATADAERGRKVTEARRALVRLCDVGDVRVGGRHAAGGEYRRLRRPRTTSRCSVPAPSPPMLTTRPTFERPGWATTEPIRQRALDRTREQLHRRKQRGGRRRRSSTSAPSIRPRSAISAAAASPGT